MQVFLFDIDGTLLDTNGAGGTAVYSALSEEFQVVEPTRVEYSGHTDRGIARSLFRVHGIDDTSENWERLRAACLRLLPLHLANCMGSVLPGVPQILDQLCSMGAAIGLLTGNTREGANLKLRHFKIDQHFEFGAYGDIHLERDDVARDAVVAVAAHLGEQVRPRDIWVIGDTPRDIRCARAIGANVVAVATGIHERSVLFDERPDLLFDDLSDVESFLKYVT